MTRRRNVPGCAEVEHEVELVADRYALVARRRDGRLARARLIDGARSQLHVTEAGALVQAQGGEVVVGGHHAQPHGAGGARRRGHGVEQAPSHAGAGCEGVDGDQLGRVTVDRVGGDADALAGVVDGDEGRKLGGRLVRSRFGAGSCVASRRSAVANVAWSW
jgi:hypothetical protein